MATRVLLGVAVIAIVIIVVAPSFGSTTRLPDDSRAALSVVDQPTKPDSTSSSRRPAATVSSDSQTIAPIEDFRIRIAAAGDVGTGDEEAYATAAAVDDVDEREDYAALLLLGDNVYDDGDPAELDRTIFEPFGPILDGQTQLLAVLGNHDVRDGHGPAHAEAIGMPNAWYSTRIGDVLVVSLDSNRPHDTSQLAFLEATLSESDATWVIATMHHPPFSAGFHGPDDEVRKAFTPAFEQHGVDLVLSGHEHDYQRFEPLGGVTYIISGAGAKLRNTDVNDRTAAATSTRHFLDLVVERDSLTVRAVDQSGVVFDTVVLEPR
ncbi:MAG: metallophosphoesterase family protein [Acidimicrobiales bacterium]